MLDPAPNHPSKSVRILWFQVLCLCASRTSTACCLLPDSSPSPVQSLGFTVFESRGCGLGCGSPVTEGLQATCSELIVVESIGWFNARRSEKVPGRALVGLLQPSQTLKGPHSPEPQNPKVLTSKLDSPLWDKQPSISTLRKDSKIL